MQKIKVTFFFRKPSPQFHSIEELFANFQKYLPENIEFKNVYLPYHNGIIGRLKNLLFIKKHKSQINHITGDINYIAAALPKNNTILTIHDIGSVLRQTGLKGLIIKQLWLKLPLKKIKTITTISEFSKTEIVKEFGINPDKIRVIHNCFSDKFSFHKKNFNSKKPNILIIGTKANKNLPRYFEALQNIPCKLTIIGRLTDEQKQLLTDNQLDYENFFNLPFDEVVEKYRQADLLLFASLYEGFGVPILEAQATGVPVVTSDIDPMKTIAGNNSALLVNPEKVNEIRSAVQQIINDEQKREEIIEKGLKNAEKYRCSAVAKKYAKLYQQLL